MVENLVVIAQEGGKNERTFRLDINYFYYSGSSWIIVIKYYNYTNGVGTDTGLDRIVEIGVIVL